MAMPGRTQSEATSVSGCALTCAALIGKRSVAALLLTVRSPGRSRVTLANVGHERDFVYLGQGVEPRPCRAVALRREAQPVHARIHLEEDPVRDIGFVGGQHVHLFVAVHGVPQVQARTQLQVAQLKDTFEQ
jgi:hypothetical protein